jgi:hypothetical protein
MKKVSDIELTPSVLVESEKRRNPCDSEMQLGWSAPGVACKTVAPTPAMMGTYSTRGTSRRPDLLLNLSQ